MDKWGSAWTISSSNLTVRLQLFLVGELSDIILVVEPAGQTLACNGEESYLERIDKSIMSKYTDREIKIIERLAVRG